MADTAAVEVAPLPKQQQQQQNLCHVCSGKLSEGEPAACGHSVCGSCLGDKSKGCPQCPVKPGSPKQNGTADAHVNKNSEEQSQESTTAEETEIQKDLNQSEDPKKPEEDKKEAEPQTEEGPKEDQDKEEPLGPDDVVCDSCIESPRRALKSCLTCLVSYCEAHLRPHLENPKFQNHRLVDPLRDIERRTCESHKWPLDLFCSTDSCCICQDCVNEDHKGHNTVSVVDARNQIEASVSLYCVHIPLNDLNTSDMNFQAEFPTENIQFYFGSP